VARQPKILLEELEKLASLQCTLGEVASYFKVTITAVDKCLAKKPEFRAAWQRGQDNGRISLRRAQVQKALAGNPTMLIWMGKQILGQKDQHELGGITDAVGNPAGAPVQFVLSPAQAQMLGDPVN
jgi:hypothetical protein